MKFLSLVWKNLGRRKVRTTFTSLAIVVAFLLFGILSAIRVAFRAGVDVTGADRLMVSHKVSIIQPLPIAYRDQIAHVPGVREVTHVNWFAGVYKDPKNVFPRLAVDPATYLDIYPEIKLPEAAKRAWLADRTGAIVGRFTADRFGFKVGDRIPILATIYTKRDGGRTWEFTVDGIYDAAKGIDTSALLFQYDFLKEASFASDRVGWYIIRIADPQHAQQVVDRIDKMFANSHAETKTSTEKAFLEGFAKQAGDIGAIITGIVSAVFFTLLLVAGNTMAQSVRERTSELAVLKTLGYADGLVMGLVLLESCLLALVAGGLGLGLAWVIDSRGDPTGGYLPVFYLPARDLALGFALAAALGLATGALPAWQAMRLRIVDALRRV
ncbi:MAG TPA: FtsX-like permease family protein [Thermoanaerobaculia bacterium]|nr:FtsX-like permease family protein [Thermoanaerobaculia bacterium]